MRSKRSIVCVFVLLIAVIGGTATWATAARTPEPPKARLVAATAAVKAVTTTAKPATRPGTKPGTKPGPKPGDTDGDDLPRHCSYPPVRVPRIVVSGPDRVEVREKFTITVSVHVKDCALPGITVGLYWALPGRTTFVFIKSKVTDASGNAVFPGFQVSGDKVFLAVSSADDHYASATSNTHRVRVRSAT